MAEKRRKYRVVNPIFKDVRMMSPKQVKLAMYIQGFRQRYNLSLEETAAIFTKYGVHDNVSFDMSEISRYENCRTIPTMPKLHAMMDAIHIDVKMLQ